MSWQILSWPSSSVACWNPKGALCWTTCCLMSSCHVSPCLPAFLNYNYTLFLPRGKMRLQTSCSKGCQNPTPAVLQQIL